MDKGGSDVALSRVQLELGGEDHHETDSAPLDNGCPSFEEIDALLLTITANEEPGFKFLGKAAGKTFELEYPFGREDSHPRFTVNDGPSIDGVSF